jgi:hypothetical protein
MRGWPATWARSPLRVAANNVRRYPVDPSLRCECAALRRQVIPAPGTDPPPTRPTSELKDTPSPLIPKALVTDAPAPPTAQPRPVIFVKAGMRCACYDARIPTCAGSSCSVGSPSRRNDVIGMTSSCGLVGYQLRARTRILRLENTVGPGRTGGLHSFPSAFQTVGASPPPLQLVQRSFG